MADRFGQIDTGLKLGAVPFFGGGELGLHLTQCGLGRGLPSYQVAWHLNPSSRLATIDMGRKVWGGGLCSILGGAGSPSTKMSHGPRPTSVPSGILVHPAMPQETWAESWGGTVPLSGGVGPI